MEQEDEKRRIKNELFNKYVVPHVNMIYKLVITYSMKKSHIQDNYVECLNNYYNYIETYNPEMEIKTWLHIVCKRFIKSLEVKRSKELQQVDLEEAGSDLIMHDPSHTSENVMGVDNWRDMYSDEVLDALMGLGAIYREALLLQLAGYSLKEIAMISYRNGNIKACNVDTVKSRLFLAKKGMREALEKNGYRKTH